MFCSLGAFSQVSVDTRIENMQMLIGDQTDLILTVTAPKKSSIIFPYFKRSQYIASGVEVLRNGTSDTLDINDDMIKISKRYTLTAFDEKLYYIPALKISVNRRIYNSKNLALKVISVPVDTLHPEKFFPPKGVQTNPFDWSEWSATFWLSSILIILNLSIYYFWTRLKENKPILVHTQFVKTVFPHQKALNEIENLKAEKLADTDNTKVYYTRLTKVLREYIKERFGFNAMEMTSSEIIYHLQKEGDTVMINELRNLFLTADLVKFAKHSTLINENDANLVNAIEFINTTKTEVKPTIENVEPKLTVKEQQTMRSRYSLKIIISVLKFIGILLLIYIIYQIYLLV